MKTSKDGLQHYCKECSKKRCREFQNDTGYAYYKTIEYRLRYRSISALPENKEKRKKRFNERYRSKALAYYKEWYKNNQIKRNAEDASRSIKVDKGFHKHHWNYSDEYKTDIIILPVQKHRLAHSYMEYDNELQIYKSKIDGVLLDTKEKHIAFIDSLR